MTLKVKSQHGFYVHNGLGFIAEIVIMPFRIFEPADNEPDRAYCNFCNEELHKSREHNFEFVSHNLVQCLEVLRNAKVGVY